MDDDPEKLFLEIWTQKKNTKGLFRNPNYDATLRKVLQGKLKVSAQFNPTHLATKRPAASANAQQNTVHRPFDESVFNFKKASEHEIVTVLDGHPIFVNVNPLTVGHSLFVPYLSSGLPQLLNREVLGAALKASTVYRDFKIGFNSIGAWASVNHCHFHMLHIKDIYHDNILPIERCEFAAVLETDSIQISISVDWPLKVFKFKSPDKSLLVNRSFDVISYLIELNIPHNVLISRETIFVIPRDFQLQGALDGQMAVALAETVGLAILYSEEQFLSFSEAEYCEIIASAAISEDHYQAIELLLKS
jgi:hypothetical protein